MKILRNLLVVVLCIGLLGSCANMNNQKKGALFGAGGGAALGAGIGALTGNIALGAAIGTTVGATAGALIGKKMDKQAQELSQIEGAAVETITDKNNLQAIKVTFESGILFQTDKSDLNAASQKSLTQFANSLKANPDTYVNIYGHTDNTGTHEHNLTLSKARAESVAKFLQGLGISSSRMTTEGFSYDQPVADNSTAAGRAQNRRVEIYIIANEDMIKKAENGTL